jgi:acyl-CoA reductase-like NAD-dependent aldehyde dehydrogenase
VRRARPVEDANVAEEARTVRMYIGGEWVDKPEKAVVRNKYDGAEIDTVPLADAADVERAVASAVRGAEVMRKMSPYDRYHILRRAADLLAQRQEEFGRTITLRKARFSPKASSRRRALWRP